MSTNDEATTDANPEAAAQATQESIPIREIEISPLNPRHGQEQDVNSLVEDIRDNKGLLQPILLRKVRTGQWEVIAGSRRFLAIKRMRGEDEGEIRSGEFRMVDWDDDRCVRAAVSENKEREDLPPVTEGRFLNDLAKRLEEQGVKVTDQVLEDKTGLDRPRINDVRYLANFIEFLPPGWQKDLNAAPNRRPGDTVITLTHFKHVRTYVKPEGIERDVVGILDKASKEGWSARKLKDALKAREQKPSEGASDAGEEKTEKTRDPAAEPNYGKALRSLRSALVHTGSDSDLAEMIEPIITKVDDRIAEKKAENEAKGKDNAAKKAA